MSEKTSPPDREGHDCLRQSAPDLEVLEARLKASENKLKQFIHITSEYRLLFDAIPDIILFLTSDLTVMRGNLSAARQAGRSPADLRGRICHELLHGRSSPCPGCPLTDARQNGQSASRVLQLEDNAFWDIRGIPLSSPSDGLSGFITVSRNISTEKILEEQIRNQDKLDALGTLAGGIAHEFNNLLTVIIGNTSLTKLILESSSPLIKRLDDVEQASLRAKDLVRQLLTFSRGGSPIKTEVRIEPLIRDTANVVFHDRAIQFLFDIDSNLWPVDADISQLAQVVTNILINAEQAMNTPGTITVRGHNMLADGKETLPLGDGSFVCIQFHDNGPGIAPEHLNRIFDPFFSTRPMQHGLGLSTAYSIIKKHGGHITAVSQPREGTVVSIYLPAHDQGLSTNPHLSPSPEPPVRPLVLFMDDELYIQQVAGSMLDHLGFSVEYAADGREALEMYDRRMKSEKRYDLVILDLSIPSGMGGKECMEHLRTIDPAVRAIVSSGYSNDPVLAHPESYGFRDKVEKPYKLQELEAVLMQVLKISPEAS